MADKFYTIMDLAEEAPELEANIMLNNSSTATTATRCSLAAVKQTLGVPEVFAKGDDNTITQDAATGALTAKKIIADDAGTAMRFLVISQDDYSALTSVDANTMYIVIPASGNYFTLWKGGQQLQGQGGLPQSLPVGAVISSPAGSLSGYLLCNGQEVSRATYEDLFAVIGTDFGEGDGSTTFNVPDYQGCFLRGLGGDSAADTHTKQEQGLPDHTHTVSYNRSTFDGNNYGKAEPTNYTDSPKYVNTTTSEASLSNSIYGAADEVRPVNFAVNYFIKY